MGNQNANELIAKSLEEIDNLVGLFKANSSTNALAKGGANNLNPEDVSNDAPEDEDQDANADAGAEDNDAMDTDGDSDSDASDQDNDSDADADTDDEAEEDTGADEAHKSITSSITGSDTVKKALEVSDFLRDLVQGISSVIEAQSAEFGKSITASTATQDMLSKSFQGIVTVQRAVLETQAEILKSNSGLQESFDTMQKSLNRANNRLKALEDQPLVRKSVATAPAKVIEKSFGGATSATNTLSKSEASDRLMSAFNSGNTGIMTDLLAFDSTGDFNVLSSEGKKVLGITQ